MDVARSGLVGSPSKPPFNLGACARQPLIWITAQRKRCRLLAVRRLLGRRRFDVLRAARLVAAAVAALGFEPQQEVAQGTDAVIDARQSLALVDVPELTVNGTSANVRSNRLMQRLRNAAQREGRSEIVDFAQQLMLHARTEEEVMYPAAILVGKFVRQRLGQPKPAAG